MAKQLRTVQCHSGPCRGGLAWRSQSGLAMGPRGAPRPMIPPPLVAPGGTKRPASASQTSPYNDDPPPFPRQENGILYIFWMFFMQYLESGGPIPGRERGGGIILSWPTGLMTKLPYTSLNRDPTPPGKVTSGQKCLISIHSVPPQGTPGPQKTPPRRTPQEPRGGPRAPPGPNTRTPPPGPRHARLGLPGRAPKGMGGPRSGTSRQGPPMSTPPNPAR